MRELSLNVMDIAQNSVRAKASVIKIEITEDTEQSTLEIKITDDGCGMSEEQVKSVIDPFFTTRTTRKVGLGIPLFKMAAEQTGGYLDIKSQLGKGTVVTAKFISSHMDMTPLGDINSTISILIRCNPDTNIVFTHSVDNKTFSLDTRELKEVLGDVPLDTPEVMQWIDDYLKEQTEILYGGAL